MSIKISPIYYIVNIFFTIIILFFYFIRINEIIAMFFGNLMQRIMIIITLIALISLFWKSAVTTSGWVRRLGLVCMVRMFASLLVCLLV